MSEALKCDSTPTTCVALSSPQIIQSFMVHQIRMFAHDPSVMDRLESASLKHDFGHICVSDKDNHTAALLGYFWASLWMTTRLKSKTVGWETKWMLPGWFQTSDGVSRRYWFKRLKSYCVNIESRQNKPIYMRASYNSNLPNTCNSNPFPDIDIKWIQIYSFYKVLLA